MPSESTTGPEGGGETLSCTLITTPPNSLLVRIDNMKPRMRAALRQKDHAAWLTGSPEDARAAPSPYPSDMMEAWPGQPAAL